MVPSDPRTWKDAFRESAFRFDDNLCVIDAGKVRCCVGLRATFYFGNGTDPGVRSRIVRVLERYENEGGRHLKWGANPTTTKPRKLAGTDFATPQAWMKLIDEPEWNMVFHGAERRDDASPYTFICLARQLRNFPSWVTFTLPLSWLGDKGPAGLAPLVADCCNILTPLHGYAGLSVIQHVNEAGESPAMRDMQGLAFRFLGLEVDFPEFLARHLVDGIKGVNWLTILDETRLGRVGGRESLQRELGDEFVFHPFPGGVVIQAGPHPVFGDVNRQEDLSNYRKLARLLKPIRVTYPHSMASMSGGAFSVEKTKEWFERFDTRD